MSAEARIGCHSLNVTPEMKKSGSQSGFWFSGISLAANAFYRVVGFPLLGK
jgi:hypothetical protein